MKEKIVHFIVSILVICIVALVINLGITNKEYRKLDHQNSELREKLRASDIANVQLKVQNRTLSDAVSDCTTKVTKLSNEQVELETKYKNIEIKMSKIK
jgi:predicted nuclease with TOPRIM domain